MLLLHPRNSEFLVPSVDGVWYEQYFRWSALSLAAHGRPSSFAHTGAELLISVLDLKEGHHSPLQELGTNQPRPPSPRAGIGCGATSILQSASKKGNSPAAQGELPCAYVCGLLCDLGTVSGMIKMVAGRSMGGRWVGGGLSYCLNVATK